MPAFALVALVALAAGVGEKRPIASNVRTAVRQVAMDWVEDDSADQAFKWSTPIGAALLTVLHGLLLRPAARVAAELKEISVPGIVLANESTTAMGGVFSIGYNLTDLHITGLDSTSKFTLEPDGEQNVRLTSSLSRLSASCTIEAEATPAVFYMKPMRMRMRVTTQLTDVGLDISVKCILRKHMLRSLIQRSTSQPVTASPLRPELALSAVTVSVGTLSTSLTRADAANVDGSEQVNLLWRSFNSLFSDILKKQVEREVQAAVREGLEGVIAQTQAV